MDNRPKKSNDKLTGIVMEPVAVSIQNAARLLGISDRTLYDMTNMEGLRICPRATEKWPNAMLRQVRSGERPTVISI